MPYFERAILACKQIEVEFVPEFGTVDLILGNDIRLCLDDIEQVYGLMDVLQDAARAMAKFQSERGVME